MGREKFEKIASKLDERSQNYIFMDFAGFFSLEKITEVEVGGGY